jgi:hypothetical protein
MTAIGTSKTVSLLSKNHRSKNFLLILDINLNV